MMSTLGDLVTGLSASTELWLLSKATAVMLLGLTAAWGTRHAKASVRHLMLASTFVVLLILPIAMYLMPAVAIPIARSSRAAVASTPASQQGQPGPSASAAASAATEVQSPTVSRRAVMISLWFFGVGTLGISFALGLWRLSRLRRRGLPWLEARAVLAPLASGAGIHRSVEVLLHEDVAAPMTCGFFRPAIVLPADVASWDEAALRRALVHELEHVRRRDWWIHMLARAVCVVYWFHPLVWMAYRQLGLTAEHACDDAVLEREESTQYAEQLVTLARKMGATHAQPALAMARRSDLSARVSAVLDTQRPRGRAGLLRVGLVIIAAAGIALTLAPMRVVSAAIASPSLEQRGNERRARVSYLDRALVEAADEGSLQDVTEMLDSGANVNAAVDGDGSPLIVAAREGHLNIVTLLLERGADPNLAVSGDGNALIMAAREGHTAIVDLLLARGANINEVVPGDENALIQASGEGQLDVVKLLVARGADVNARVFAEAAYERPQGEWRTPLGMALKGGHAAVVAFLRSAGASQ